MFNKNLFLLLLNVSLSLSEVTITPSKEIVIKEGEPLKIICSASEKVDFFFPKNVPGLVTTSPTSFSSESADGATKFILKRSKSVFGDTGWYGCVESSKNQRKLNERELLVTPDAYDEIEIKWVYVYVKSEVYPFIFDTMQYFLSIVENQDVIFPCRPTSPDYKVTLIHAKYSASPIKPLEGKDYDPKIGFSFSNVKNESDGYYYCQAENSFNQTISITIPLSVHKASKYSPVLGIYTETPQQLTLGGDYSMVCHIEYRQKFNFDPLVWNTPKKDHPTGKPEVEIWVLGTYQYFNTLTIRNITEDDLGEYKCHFYGAGVIQTTKIDLPMHVKITKPSKKFEVEEVKQYETVTADCEAKGYPVPEIFWEYTNHFKNLNDNSPENSSHEIKSTVEGNKRKSTIKFKVLGTGKLVCHASNGASEDSADVKIFNVPVSLKVQLKAPTEFKEVSISEGEPLTIDCNSTEKIKFFYPRSTHTSENKITFNTSEHSSRFERQRTVFGDTGWYACVNLPEKNEKVIEYSVSVTPDEYDGPGVQWVYVFVKSNDHPFVEDSIKNAYDFYTKDRNDKFVPCRVTSKDFNVTLQTGDKVVEAEYDPKRGMLIKNMQKDDPRRYNCSTTNEDGIKRSKEFEVASSDFEDMLSLLQSSALGRMNQVLNVTAGSYVIFNCSSSLYKFQQNVSWYNCSQLHEAQCNSVSFSERVSVENSENQSFGLSKLSIINIQKWDEGDYICKAEKYDGTTEENHYHLHVNVSAVISASVFLQLSIIFLFYFM